MYKVPIDDVAPGIILDQDIYSESGKGNPLLCAGQIVTANFLYRLRHHGIRYVSTKLPETFGKKHGNPEMRRQKNMLARIANIPVEKSKPAVKPKTTKEVLKTMKEFHISLSGLDVKAVCKVVSALDNIISVIINELPENLMQPVNVHHLRGIETYPVYSYLYRHSLNVAVVAMAMGQYMNLPREEVLALGKCASMHDVGMFLIPVEILGKTSELDEPEMETVRSHAVLGYHWLKKMQAVDDRTYQGIATHHERLDGSGYPLGLTGDNIPLWGRIIAVADVYDAMTSVRPYRAAMSPAEACEFIMGSANRAFDYNIVAAILRRIEFYPVGVCVELSNKNLAVILENSKNKLRPTVQMVDTNTVIDLSDRNHLDITIIRAVSYKNFTEG